MSFKRRILHYSPGPTDFVGELSDRVVKGCWFELRRQGGCGAGELTLKDSFSDRAEIEIGDWIACEFDTGDRWYLGKVVKRSADVPAGVRLRLAGMSAELEGVFVGGFGSAVGDGSKPHRYARTDLFPDDPDHADETVDSVNIPKDVVSLLVQQYVAPRTPIAYDAGLITTPLAFSDVTSLKFRGEESAWSILRHLAVVARDAAWGVNEDGTFFFLRKCSHVEATYRIGRDPIEMVETRDRDLLSNRLLLTGDYIYTPPDSGDSSPGVYRWRAIYTQPASRDLYGERAIRLWVPWVRTAADSREFAREFFRVYAEPVMRWWVEVGDRSVLPRPWLSRIRLEDQGGNEIVTTFVDTIRVQFDHRPRLRMILGPADPRERWPEPPHDERWPVPSSPASGYGGDLVTLGTTGEELTESCPGSESAPPSSSEPPSSGGTSDLTSSFYTEFSSSSSDSGTTGTGEG